MLLKIMADTGNIGRHLYSVCQTHPGNLAQSRVRLFRCCRIHPGADAPFLRTTLKSRRCRLISFVFPAHTDELINCRHNVFSPSRNIPVAPQKEANRDTNKIASILSTHFFTKTEKTTTDRKNNPNPLSIKTLCTAIGSRSWPV